MRDTTNAAERRQGVFGLYTEDELALLLDIQPATLATWRSQGQGPHYTKLGKSVFYRHEDIQQWSFDQVLPVAASLPREKVSWAPPVNPQSSAVR